MVRHGKRSALACIGNPSGFTTSGLSSLTVNVQPNTSFNGPFSASIMSQIDVTGTNSNFQSRTLNTVGVVNLTLSGATSTTASPSATAAARSASPTRGDAHA
jgi:hypothetical protein